jgi:hypothetical protein
MSASTVYAAFWASLDGRDWEGFRACLAADVVALWPQSRERVTGADALVAFMAAYPGDWRLEVVALHADGTGAATQVAFTADGLTVPGLTFFTVDAVGRIAGFTEFWPEPYDPPVNRAHLVERY